MLVSEAMTRDVRVCTPVHSIRDCARVMAEIDAGVLPVAEKGFLVGMVTDRDIAVRAVAAGKGPDTPVGEVLSKEVLYCFCAGRRALGLSSAGTSRGTDGSRRRNRAVMFRIIRLRAAETAHRISRFLLSRS